VIRVAVLDLIIDSSVDSRVLRKPCRSPQLDEVGGLKPIQRN